VSFTVERGVTAGLLGANGAGKTTTLSILLGLLLPSSGSVRIFGEDVLRHRYRVLPRLNFSSPYVDLPHRLTVRQNLAVYARLYGVSQRNRTIARLAADLQIDTLLDRPAGKLSAGQKTRVALAKSLLNDPELLLLDEPTGSLDPDTGDWVRGYLEDYRDRTGATILLASHNMAEVERMCSEVMMLKAGRLVDHGSPDELIRRYGRTDLEEVFLQIARGRQVELEPVS
jgi:ABC-2 type transport system ATP-binding protein